MHLTRFFVFFSKATISCNQTRYFATTTTTASNRVTHYLQRAKLIDSIRLALRSDNSQRSLLPLLNDPVLDSFVVTHALRSAPSPDSALSFLETLKSIPNFTHTQTTLHAIAKILAKSKRIPQLQTLIDAINSGKFTNVARVGFMDLLRWNVVAGDLDSAVRVWNEYRLILPEQGKKKRLCTESYNLLMSVYAQKGKDLEAVEMFGQMIKEGANPNSRTYTVVIEHLMSSGRLEAAYEVFDKLPLMRFKRTLKQYSVLTEGFTGIERFDVVKKLLKEMKVDGVLPGHAMKVSLNCIRDAGFLEETEEFVRELLPDERIRSIGFSVNESDEENEFGDEDDSEGVGVGVQLKPWLDPSALASALSDWDPNEVSALEEARFVWTTRLVCKMLRSFKNVETAWKFFVWVAYQPGEFTHDVYTVSRMIVILARHGHVELLDQLVSKVKREGVRLSFSTVRLIIDFYGISKKADAALGIFYDVESLAGPIMKSNLSLLYSSLFRTLIKCKRGLHVMELLDEMIVSGVLPDIQTFTGLMQHFALEGDLKMVQRLFGMVRQSGLNPDAYMFRILIRAYCKSERSTLALRVFEDMRNLNLIPDAATKELLVKSLWKEGKLREAAAVEERSEEINDMLQLALPGHVWTVNAADITAVYNIYSNSFATDGDYSNVQSCEGGTSGML